LGFNQPGQKVSISRSQTLAAATSDPVGFVADLPERATLDEVQRAPALFTAIKAAVDRARRPGRILLTGSANVLLLPKLADSLAGRMEILRVHPLAQCEIAANRPRFLDHLFAGHFNGYHYERLGRELAERVSAGGFPAALARPLAVVPLGIATTLKHWSSATCVIWRASIRSTRFLGSWRWLPDKPHACST